MKKIAIFNRKGGVGKTVCAASLGAILSHAGKKVLLVDLDSQANLTHSFLREEPEEDVSQIFDTGRLPVTQISLFLSIVPASIQLAATDYQIAGREDRYEILPRALAKVDEEYDLAIMDLAPSMNHICIGAVSACDYLLAPILPDVDSLQGLHMVEDVCRIAGKEGGIDGIFFSIFNRRRDLDRYVEEVLRREYGEVVYRTTIRQSNKLRECRSQRKDIETYAPSCAGAKDYRQLADEILQRIINE